MKVHQLKIDFNVTEEIKRFVYIYIMGLAVTVGEEKMLISTVIQHLLSRFEERKSLTKP